MNENQHDEIEYDDRNSYLYGENYETFYANSLDMRTSITDFMVNFKQGTPEGYLSNSKIIMNPSLAKELRNALNEAIERDESIHGEIKDIQTLQIEMSNYNEEELKHLSK
ncbi:DUF3467 domain-containing protein, partial [Staphylococcus gallinarum]